MKLPKRDLPELSATLPIGKTEFTYRPYTVKEDRVLMLAANSEGNNDKLTAIRQIVSNCTSLDIAKLHPTDFEWVFMQLRKASVSPIVELIYNVSPEHCGLPKDSDKECPEALPAHFNINDMTISSNGEMDISDIATPAKGGGWVISLGETVSLHLNPTMPDEEGETLIYGMLKSVIDDGNIIPKTAFSEEEFDIYLDENVLPSELAVILQFVSALPTTEVKIDTTCQMCTKSFTYTASGIIDFLV